MSVIEGFHCTLLILHASTDVVPLKIRVWSFQNNKNNGIPTSKNTFSADGKHNLFMEWSQGLHKTHWELSNARTGQKGPQMAPLMKHKNLSFPGRARPLNTVLTSTILFPWPPPLILVLCLCHCPLTSPWKFFQMKPWLHTPFLQASDKIFLSKIFLSTSEFAGERVNITNCSQVNNNDHFSKLLQCWSKQCMHLQMWFPKNKGVVVCESEK